jgi:hypothetical protein
MSEGLLPRKALAERRIPSEINDPLRIDGHLDASCVSIEFPNDRLFFKYRKIASPADWVVLEMPVRVLWEYKCAFCPVNAANIWIKSEPVADWVSPNALRSMFDKGFYVEPQASRSSELPRSWPTHPQAEVLVFGTIPAVFIEAVYFENKQSLALEAAVETEETTRSWGVHSSLFSPRCDSEQWAPRCW